MLCGCVYAGMTRSAFIDIASSLISTQDRDYEIRQVFLAFDISCAGFLTLKDLRSVFQRIAPHIKPAVIESIFVEIDADRDGRISFHDFERMMRQTIR